MECAYKYALNVFILSFIWIVAKYSLGMFLVLILFSAQADER